MVEYRVYGEVIDSSDAQPRNLRGQAYAIYDTAGRVRQQQFSIQGALLESSRTLLDDLATDVDFAALRTAVEGLYTPSTTTSIANIDAVNPSTVLSTATGNTFDQSTTHDALGRVLTQTTPDDSVTHYGYDAGSRLTTVDVDIRGVGTLTSFVSTIEYNARGQRTLVAWREETDAGPPTEDRPIMTTTLTYDDYRFWLTRLVTERDSVSSNTAATMQDLTYSRDRVGNITGITDDAQDTLYFNNTTVTADQTFVYDGLYRLTAATGREKDNLGQPGAAYSGGTGSIPQAAGSMRQYRQEYDYDEAGNIIQMVHSAGPGTGGTTFWRRVYAYGDKNNQLIANSKPGESVTKTRAELQADPSSVDLTELNDTYTYNDRGAMTFLPHLDTSGSTNVTRDFRDQIRELAVGTSAGTAHYAYDAGGIRVAKLWDKSGAVELRVYIGSYEVFRSASSVSGLSSPSTELHTLHVMDGERRVAMVETYTAGAPTGVTGNRIRMQLGNHLGTACIETDKDGGLLTYEEFHPYGTTAWWAEKSGLEVSAKRYRYTGMERDEESGLQYHNARYYMPWLGRWERVDPAGMPDGANRFSYCVNSPVQFSDSNGMEARPRPRPSVKGTAQIVAAMVGNDTDWVQDRLYQLTDKVWQGESFSDDELQFLSDFYRVVEAGAWAKGRFAHRRLKRYFHGDGSDLEHVEALGNPYRSSRVVKRAQDLLTPMIEESVSRGETQGTIDSTAIQHGDKQKQARDPKHYRKQGIIRGQDWDGSGTYSKSLRGYLWTEQGNERLKNADNNFILSADWVVGDDGVVEIEWSVRDHYVFKSADDVRALGLSRDFGTDIPTRPGGLGKTIRAPDSLFAHAVELGWAKDYYGVVRWKGRMELPQHEDNNNGTK